jgi:hypothetical protein
MKSFNIAQPMIVARGDFNEKPQLKDCSDINNGDIDVSAKQQLNIERRILSSAGTFLFFPDIAWTKMKLLNKFEITKNKSFSPSLSIAASVSNSPTRCVNRIAGSIR